VNRGFGVSEGRTNHLLEFTVNSVPTVLAFARARLLWLAIVLLPLLLAACNNSGGGSGY
jgi:hypothetical protein